MKKTLISTILLMLVFLNSCAHELQNNSIIDLENRTIAETEESTPSNGGEVRTPTPTQEKIDDAEQLDEDVHDMIETQNPLDNQSQLPTDTGEVVESVSKTCVFDDEVLCEFVNNLELSISNDSFNDFLTNSAYPFDCRENTVGMDADPDVNCKNSDYCLFFSALRSEINCIPHSALHSYPDSANNWQVVGVFYPKISNEVFYSTKYYEESGPLILIDLSVNSPNAFNYAILEVYQVAETYRIIHFYWLRDVIVEMEMNFTENYYQWSNN